MRRSTVLMRCCKHCHCSSMLTFSKLVMEAKLVGIGCTSYERAAMFVDRGTYILMLKRLSICLLQTKVRSFEP
jgi:hypothetical protein